MRFTYESAEAKTINYDELPIGAMVQIVPYLHNYDRFYVLTNLPEIHFIKRVASDGYQIFTKDMKQICSTWIHLYERCTFKTKIQVLRYLS